MRRFSILYIFFASGFLSYPLKSQTLPGVSIDIGPTLKEPSQFHNYELSKIIAVNKDYIFSIDASWKWGGPFSNSPGKLEIARHHQSTLDQRTKIDLESLLGDRRFEACIELDNKFYVFSSAKNSSSTSIVLYAQQVNLDLFEIGKELITVNEWTITDNVKYEACVFSLGPSADGKKLIVLSNFYTALPSISITSVFVVNSNLKPIWRDEIQFKVEDYVLLEKGKFTNQGEFFMLIRRFSNASDLADHFKLSEWHDAEHFSQYYSLFSDKRIPRVPNYKFEVLSFRNYGKQKNTLVLDRNDIFINSAGIETNDSAKIMVFGLYGEAGRYSTKGCFVMTFNQALDSLTAERKFAFTNSFLIKGHSKDSTEILKKIIDNEEFDNNAYELRNVITSENGSYLLVAEHHIKGLTVGTSSVKRHHYRDWYTDVIVCNFSQDGQLVWTQKLVKVQDTEGTALHYASFQTIPIHNDLFIVYNKFHKFSIFPKKITAELTKIDANGRITNQELFNWEKDRKMLLPERYFLTNNNEAYFYGSNDIKYNFVRLRFK